MNDSGAVFAGLFVLPLGIATLVFWVRMLEDCAAHEDGKAKLFWILLLLMPHFTGLLPFYFLKWRPRRRAELGLTG